jgi:uncharacterized protein
VVEVEVRRDSRQRLSSLFASGHAGWADAGQDVVCAAVSAILQAAWLGLAEVANVPLEAHKEEGNLTLRWPKFARDDRALQAIVGTAERSIDALARQYPEHVRLRRQTEP